MTGIVLGEGGLRFDFAELHPHGDGTERYSAGWAHHGIAVAANGQILTFHPELSQLLVLDPDGHLRRTVAVDVVTEGHGFTLVSENETTLLWIADTGAKARPQDDGTYPVVTRGHGAAIQIDLDGTPIRRIDAPELPVYQTMPFRPTAVAVDERRFGGDGDIWIADGYGAELVHHFDENGRYLDTLDGTAGAGRFHQPHSVFLDRRRSEPEIYVADRLNRRVQVFDRHGCFRRSFGQDFLLSPSGFANYGQSLIVAELDARILILSANDELVASLGGPEVGARQRPGWPNAIRGGRTVRPDVVPGHFHTPHGIATDGHGTIYVTEWLIGGRLVTLTPTPPHTEDRET